MCFPLSLDESSRADLKSGYILSGVIKYYLPLEGLEKCAMFAHTRKGVLVLAVGYCRGEFQGRRCISIRIGRRKILLE